MEQIVLVFGTIAASAMGLALLAQILGGILRNSRVRRSENLRPPLFTQEVPAPEQDYLATAIRGYDTPELCQQDKLLRAQFQSRSVPDDVA